MRRRRACEGEPTPGGSGPGGVLGTNPRDLAQAESRASGTECARRKEAREAWEPGGAADEARTSEQPPGEEERETNAKPESDAAPGALRPGQASVAATASFPEKVAS